MGVMNRLAAMMNIGNDNDDEYDYDDEDDYVEEPEPSKNIVEEPKAKINEKKSHDIPRRRIQMNDSSVCVFKPKAFDEAREMVETLLENKTVLINFEGVDISISQRVLDIVTGACIAVGGNLQKISNFIFIATPASVDVSGEFQDALTGAFDAL